jgi:hypothetical protein
MTANQRDVSKAIISKLIDLPRLYFVTDGLYESTNVIHCPLIRWPPKVVISPLLKE